MMYLRKYSTCAEPDCTVILNRHCLWKRKSNSWLTRNKATNAIFSAERWKRSQRTTLESVWIIKLKTNGYFLRQFDVFTFARILMRYFKSRCLTHLGHIYTCHLRHKPFISVKGWPTAWISRLHLRFRIWQTALEIANEPQNIWNICQGLITDTKTSRTERMQRVGKHNTSQNTIVYHSTPRKHQESFAWRNMFRTS